MTEDQLVEKLVSLFKGLRYSQRTWTEDARDIIAMVRENTPGTDEKIDELRECLILTVKELELPPNAPTATLYKKGVLTRSRKALGLQP